MVTDKQKKFVEMYLGEAELNATKAAILAGYSARNADKIGPELLGKTRVQVYMAQRRKELAESTAVTPERVLLRWMALADVDANDLVEYRRDCCRHCWGDDHLYQWTDGEFTQAQKEADDSGGDQPDIAGGFGFIATRPPHPECPECSGEGHGKIHVHDTRKLKGAARELYNGVHQGKDGLKLLLRDRDKALEQVTKILGMYESQEAKDRAQELHRLEVEAKRLAIAKASRDLEDPDDDKPTPVKIVVEVKDARKRDDAEP